MVAAWAMQQSLTQLARCQAGERLAVVAEVGLIAEAPGQGHLYQFQLWLQHQLAQAVL